VEHDGIYLYLVEQGNFEYSSDDVVKMTYTGQSLGDNFTFAKDKVVTFEYGNSGLIKGIDMALPYIKQGSKGYILVPFKYGYGKRRVGQIEPYSTLLFTFAMQ
jgi:FKBP-type peptidyl-prolyl cis-trans isomerase FklB